MICFEKKFNLWKSCQISLFFFSGDGKTIRSSINYIELIRYNPDFQVGVQAGENKWILNTLNWSDNIHLPKSKIQINDVNDMFSIDQFYDELGSNKQMMRINRESNSKFYRQETNEKDFNKILLQNTIIAIFSREFR